MGNRTMSKVGEEVQRTEERLASNVLPSEYEDLMSQRYELNDAILWKKVETACFKELLEFVEKMLFKPSAFTKVLPTSNLFDDGDFLNDVKGGGARETLRRHFLTLHSVKKILGILKTRVKEELNVIQTVSPEEEAELYEIIEVVSRKKYQGREDQEVIPLPLLQFKTPPEEENMGEIIVSRGKIERKKLERNCLHTYIRTTYRKDVQGVTHEERVCKMCDSWLGEDEITPLTARITKKKDKRDCKHQTAEWVPGKEGKVARCGELGCEFILKKAHTYKWREAGLEPFGDDPSKDEILLFGEHKAEVEA